MPMEVDTLDEISSLHSLCEHVKTAHDVILYSTPRYSCQQVLCGRLIKAAHMWLSKENQTFAKTHPKERKIKRQGKGGPSVPYLDTPIELLVDHETPMPPLTPERVQRGPLVRPEYPRTSLAFQNLEHRGLTRMSVGLCVQEWAVQAAHGLLGADTTEVMRQVDPIYSPEDLYPGPSSEAPGWWFAPDDAEMLIRLTGNAEMEDSQKIVFALFLSAVQLIRESQQRPRLMDCVYNFAHLSVIMAPLPLRLRQRVDRDPECELYHDSDWEIPVPVHGVVRGALHETIRKVPEAYFAEGITDGVLDTTYSVLFTQMGNGGFDTGVFSLWNCGDLRKVCVVRCGILLCE